MFYLMLIAGNYLRSQLSKIAADELGQGFVEYMLVLGVIVVALFLAVQTTGIETTIKNSLETLAGCFTTPGIACS